MIKILVFDYKLYVGEIKQIHMWRWWNKEMHDILVIEESFFFFKFLFHLLIHRVYCYRTCIFWNCFVHPVAAAKLQETVELDLWPSRHKSASPTIRLWTDTVFPKALENTRPCLNYHCISVFQCWYWISLNSFPALMIAAVLSPVSPLLQRVDTHTHTHTHTHTQLGLPSLTAVSSCLVCLFLSLFTPSDCLVVDCQYHGTSATSFGKKKTARGLPQVNRHTPESKFNKKLKYSFFS